MLTMKLLPYTIFNRGIGHYRFKLMPLLSTQVAYSLGTHYQGIASALISCTYSGPLASSPP